MTAAVCGVGDIVAVPTGVGRRALVTAGAVLIVLGLGHVPLPVDGRVLGISAGQARMISAGALGVMPFIWWYLAVEWGLLIVPPWRRLRHGSRAERETVTRVAWGLGALSSVVQAYGITTYLRGLRLPGVPGAALADGDIFLTGALLVGGALVSAALAILVERRGLGNGWAVLMLAVALEELVAVWFGFARREVPGLPLAVAGQALIVLGVARWLRRPIEVSPGEVVPRITLPTCGAVPLSLAAWMLTVSATLAGYVPALAPLQEALRPGSLLYQKAFLVVAALLAVVLVAVFSAPSAVARSWEQLAGTGLAEAGQVARQELSRANQRSVLFVVALAVLPILASEMGIPLAVSAGGLATVALAAAVVLDLIADVHTYSGPTPLAALRPLHRVHAVEPALAALRQAGIPATARSLHVRSIFHFFAPYAPVELLVPAECAEQATAVVEPILADGATASSGLAAT